MEPRLLEGRPRVDKPVYLRMADVAKRQKPPIHGMKVWRAWESGRLEEAAWAMDTPLFDEAAVEKMAQIEAIKNKRLGR